MGKNGRVPARKARQGALMPGRSLGIDLGKGGLRANDTFFAGHYGRNEY